MGVEEIKPIPPIEGPRPPEMAVEHKVAVVVAGVNRPDYNQYNIPPRGRPPKKDPAAWHRTYFKMAKTYISDWAFVSGGITRVLVFDFLTGEVLEFVKGSSSEKNGTPIAPRLKPLVDANYRFADGSGQSYKLLAKIPTDKTIFYWTGLERYAAANGIDLTKTDVPIDDYWREIDRWVAEEGSMGMDTVYATVATLPAGCVREMHFFGHAFWDGPVIVNTLRAFDGGGAPWLPPGPGTTLSGTKSRFDKDCRSADTPLRLARFRAPFANDAVVGLWGCDIDLGEVRKVLLPAMERYKEGKGLTAAQRSALEGKLQRTYAQAFALFTQHTRVRAPLFGTWSMEDVDADAGIKPDDLKPKLMHINFATGARYLQFWKDAMGMAYPKTGLYAGHHAFGRGFAIFPVFVPP